MVTFDSRNPGTPAAVWTDARIALSPRVEIDGFSELIVFAAHPDDETLGAGGLIHAFAERHLPVQVVVVTDGAATRTSGIARRRSRELQDAVAILAPAARITELGFVDAATDQQSSDIRKRISAVIARSPSDALLVAPWEGDAHVDHETVGHAVRDAADGRAVLQYPIWMWHWADPSDPTLPWEWFRVFPIDGAVKLAAIAEHRSQLEGHDPMLRPEMVEHFIGGAEVYVEIRPASHLDAGYFDDMFVDSDDPWGFRTRWYEERKRAATLAALTRRRYGSALEVGSSIGILTESLATRCDSLLAVDISAEAVERARRRVGDRARVEVQNVAESFPAGPFDLIVVSEVGYYFPPEALPRVLEAARDALSPSGEIVACHWRHDVDDYPLTGDEVHAALARTGLSRLVRHEEEDFLLEVFARDATSVAHREGLT